MAIIAQFDTLKFGISGSTAMLFSDMKLSAGSETEDKASGNQQYAARKNGKPAEITKSIILEAALGMDVETMTREILNAAQRGTQGYFYIGGKKVFPCKMMLVNAETEETELSPSGKWVRAKINITMRQSTAEWIIGAPAPAPQPTPQKATVKITQPVVTAPQAANTSLLQKAYDLTVAPSGGITPGLAASSNAIAKLNATVQAAKRPRAPRQKPQPHLRKKQKLPRKQTF